MDPPTHDMATTTIVPTNTRPTSVITTVAIGSCERWRQVRESSGGRGSCSVVVPWVGVVVWLISSFARCILHCRAFYYNVQ
jgi:hypothetical protein